MAFGWKSEVWGFKTWPAQETFDPGLAQKQ